MMGRRRSSAPRADDDVHGLDGGPLDLLREAGADVRVSYDTDSTRLHAKAWLFHRHRPAASSSLFFLNAFTQSWMIEASFSPDLKVPNRSSSVKIDSSSHEAA